jgi:tetratricopeptide (TPR) repeat protein
MVDMKAAILLVALLSVLPVGTAVRGAELTREEAARSLSDVSAQTRRDAVARLGEVGTMADVPLLVKALRDPDEETRSQADRALWRIWARSGDPEVDRLYAIGMGQMNAGDLDESIATFSRIIELKPAFAEGWNKRATLYFFVGELRKSLADCDEVIRRNPYHYGALAGYAQIYARLGQYKRALDYARRALEINPNLDAVRDNIDVLEHLLEQERGTTT